MSDNNRLALVQQALTDLAAAWNKGDATAYGALFTDDADYITFFGLHLKGRQAIEDSHRHLFEGPMKGSQMSGADGTDIRLLSTDVALVVSNGGGTTVNADAAPDPERQSVVTFTAVRAGEGWLFSSFQNTRKTAVPGPPR